MKTPLSLEYFQEKLSPFESAQRNASIFIARHNLNITFQDAIERWEECEAYLGVADYLEEEKAILTQVLEEREDLDISITNLADILELELGISA